MEKIINEDTLLYIVSIWNREHTNIETTFLCYDSDIADSYVKAYFNLGYDMKQLEIEESKIVYNFNIKNI